MHVVVGVLRRLMFVFVLVVAAEHERDTARSDHERDELTGGDRVAENGPGHECSDERRSREDELPASSTEVTCARTPRR